MYKVQGNCVLTTGRRCWNAWWTESALDSSPRSAPWPRTASRPPTLHHTTIVLLIASNSINSTIRTVRLLNSIIPYINFLEEFIVQHSHLPGYLLRREVRHWELPTGKMREREKERTEGRWMEKEGREEGRMDGEEGGGKRERQRRTERKEWRKEWRKGVKGWRERRKMYNNP